MSIFNKITRRFTSPILKHIEFIVKQEALIQKQSIDDLMVLQGKAIALKMTEESAISKLQNSEFKVFSQFGEDGILQYLIRETGITRDETVFVEFGVQNYLESNTRFLLINNHWRGLIIDGTREHIDFIQNQNIYWRHDLTALHAWIDRDNINQLIDNAGFSGNIGILSIDIDGNDYWIWEKIEIVNPIIVVIEWNSVFGPKFSVSVPYEPKFDRETAHYSNLYWGASITALEHLAAKKNYMLVGSNTAGNNLFFIRKDRIGKLTQLSAKEAYIESRIRDSKNTLGKLNFLAGDKRRLEILDLPLIDTRNDQATTLRKLDRITEESIAFE